MVRIWKKQRHAHIHPGWHSSSQVQCLQFLSAPTHNVCKAPQKLKLDDILWYTQLPHHCRNARTGAHISQHTSAMFHGFLAESCLLRLFAVDWESATGPAASAPLPPPPPPPRTQAAGHHGCTFGQICHLLCIATQIQRRNTNQALEICVTAGGTCADPDSSFKDAAPTPCPAMGIHENVPHRCATIRHRCPQNFVGPWSHTTPNQYRRLMMLAPRRGSARPTISTPSELRPFLLEM